MNTTSSNLYYLIYFPWDEVFIISCIGYYLFYFVIVVCLRYLILLIFSFRAHWHNSRLTRSVFNYRERIPLVSIIVPAFNEDGVVQQSLRSLLTLDYPNYEILLIDDGSTDNTYAKALALLKNSSNINLRVISKRGGGKANALNLGLSLAKGEFILNMDADSTLNTDVLRYCIRHFDNPKIGAIAGNIKVVNRNTTLARLQALEYIEGIAIVRNAQANFGAVSIVPGPLGVFRRRALLEIGGYESDTFAEDCDLTIKLIKAGWSVVYEPKAIAYTEAPKQLGELLRQRYRWTRGILQAIHKQFSAGVIGNNKLYVATIAYMYFDIVIWPISNVIANLFLIYVCVQYQMPLAVFVWWLLILVLDVSVASYCLLLDSEQPRLLFQAIYFRFYNLMLDILKLFAMYEEVLGTKMTWNKLERQGELL